LIVPEQRVAPGVGDGQGVAVGIEVGPTLLGSPAGDSGPADSLPAAPDCDDVRTGWARRRWRACTSSPVRIRPLRCWSPGSPRGRCDAPPPGATRHGGRWFGRSVDADARTYA